MMTTVDQHEVVSGEMVVVVSWMAFLHWVRMKSRITLLGTLERSTEDSIVLPLTTSGSVRGRCDGRCCGGGGVCRRRGLLPVRPTLPYTGDFIPLDTLLVGRARRYISS